MDLCTARLLLRPWRAADRDPFAALNADPEVMAYFPAPLTRAESDALADRIQRAFAEQGGWGLFAVEERASEDFLGFTGMAPVPFETHFTPAVELGWRLARSAWGRGIATEAAAAVVALAFDHVGMDELVAFAVPANARSVAVMGRLGMTYDAAGDFDNPRVPADSPLRRHVLYRLTAEQWASRPAPRADVLARRRARRPPR